MVKTSRMCPVCGKVVADGVRFCVECGTDLSQKSQSGQSFRLSRSPIAGRKCPNCGSGVGETVRFCVDCGTDLTAWSRLLEMTPPTNFQRTPSQLGASTPTYAPEPTAKTDAPAPPTSIWSTQLLIVLSIIVGITIIALVAAVIWSTPATTPKQFVKPIPTPQPFPIPPTPTPVSPEMTSVASGSNNLGSALLVRANQALPDGNIFLSPLSVDQAVMLAYNGAAGETARQIGQTLGIDGLSTQQANDGAYGLLQSIATADPKVEIDTANSLWLQSGLAPGASYESLCSRYLGAMVGSVDFSDPNRAAEIINGWTNERTRGTIRTVVSSGDLAGADLVIANAVYFHGLWSTPFDASATKLGNFTADGNETQLPMMHGVFDVAYSEDAESQSVSLPYGSGRLAMEVVLPKAGHTVEEALTHLQSAGLQYWTDRQGSARIDLTLPKFSIDYTDASMGQELAALGMPAAFDQNSADFSSMGLPSGQFLTKVIHKATLDVDEAGGTAAAATDINTATWSTSSAPSPVSMRVDHPFFCAIYDSNTRAVLFAGIVHHPQAR